MVPMELLTTKETIMSISKRLMQYQREFNYVGLGHDFWSCKNCRTHNQTGEKTCWVCKGKVENVKYNKSTNLKETK